MPVPEGIISTSTGPAQSVQEQPNAVNNETVEEAQEVIAQEEADATEQAVVEGGSETEE